MKAASTGKSLLKRVLVWSWVLVRLLGVLLLAILVRSKRGITVVKTIGTSRHHLVDGALVCPRGHRTPLHGVFLCSRCGFVYEGSALRCLNPECKATTVHVACMVCGLSISNPYRVKV